MKRHHIIWQFTISLSAVLSHSAASQAMGQLPLFWIEPGEYKLEERTTLELGARQGEQFVGDPLVLTRTDVDNFSRTSVAGAQSLVPLLLASGGARFSVPVREQGTQVISLERRATSMSLSGTAFRELLDREGLDQVNFTMQDDDSVRMMIHAQTKLLVQVGAISGGAFRKSCNQQLEFLPVQNPYFTATGDEMTFRLMFRGRPLAFTQVRFWNRKLDRVFVQTLFTEKDGTVRTRLSNDGSWMLSAVKLDQVDGQPWQLYASTVVFGFSK